MGQQVDLRGHLGRRHWAGRLGRFSSDKSIRLRRRGNTCGLKGTTDHGETHVPRVNWKGEETTEHVSGCSRSIQMKESARRDTRGSHVCFYPCSRKGNPKEQTQASILCPNTDRGKVRSVLGPLSKRDLTVKCLLQATQCNLRKTKENPYSPNTGSILSLFDGCLEVSPKNIEKWGANLGYDSPLTNSRPPTTRKRSFHDRSLLRTFLAGWVAL